MKELFYKLAIFLIDAYAWLLSGCKISYLQFCAWWYLDKVIPESRILLALVNTTDITREINTYYDYVVPSSVFTLKQHLKMFNIRGKIVTLIFKQNDQIIHAEINLRTNQEQTTDTAIMFECLDLEDLPGTVIHSLCN